MHRSIYPVRKDFSRTGKYPEKKEMTPQCHLFFTNLNFPVLETGVYDRVYAQVLN